MEKEQFDEAKELTTKVYGMFGERIQSIINDLSKLNKEDNKMFSMGMTYVIHTLIAPMDPESRNRLLDKMKETMNTLDAMGWPEPDSENLKEFDKLITKKERPNYIG